MSGDRRGWHPTLRGIVAGGGRRETTRRLSLHLHHPPEARLLGPSHEQEDWQILDKNDPYPVGHGVRPGSPEVPVDDHHGDEDTDGVHDEGEQQIFGYEGKDEGGWGQDL